MIEIINADFTTADIPDFDVLITDPPYSAHVHKNAVSQSKTRGVRKRDLGFDSLSYSVRHHTARLAAKAKRWSVIYSDIESAWLWRLSLQAAGATYIRTIPWVRWSMPQLSGDRPTTGCELIILAYGTGKGRKHWNGPGNLTHLAHKCLRGENKHRAEKPLDQGLDLVNWFSDKDELVLDPFAGSGTFGLASQILGRSFVGFEIDKHWADIGRERIINWGNGVGSIARDGSRYNRWQETEAQRAKETTK